MKNWRTLVGALCIWRSWCSGVRGIASITRPGDVSVSPDLGRRRDRRVMSAFDEGQKAMNAAQAQAAALHLPAGPASIVDGTRTASSLPGGMTLKP